MSEKMENNWIWVALGAAVVLGGVYYFSCRRYGQTNLSLCGRLF